MGRLIRFIFIMFMLIYPVLPSYSALQGKLDYQIPIDYTKLSEEELDSKAGVYYNLALKTYNGKINDEMTTALNLYAVLCNKNPKSIFYKIRLGILYDIIGKDRYAKGCFYAAIGVDKTQPEPFFRLGEFYYRRELYKRALNMYKIAYKKGYQGHYDTLYKIGDIYEKFGDTEAALKYLKLASEKSPNSELDSKIQRVESANQINKEYYSDTRIRLIER